MAFKKGHRIGLRQWILLTLKGAIMFIALLIILNLAQYALLFSTSLYESVTVKEVRISSLVGILSSMVISFGPSILYLTRRVLQ